LNINFSLNWGKFIVGMLNFCIVSKFAHGTRVYFCHKAMLLFMFVAGFIYFVPTTCKKCGNKAWHIRATDHSHRWPATGS
jgi:hypothetical protein